MSLARLGPIPWIYCSATSTRLLVGMFTPAIRAKAESPGTRNNATPTPGSEMGTQEPASARCFAEAVRYRDRNAYVNGVGTLFGPPFTGFQAAGRPVAAERPGSA